MVNIRRLCAALLMGCVAISCQATQSLKVPFDVGLPSLIGGDTKTLHRVTIIVGKQSTGGYTRAETVESGQVLAIAEAGTHAWLELRVMSLCQNNKPSLRLRLPEPPTVPKVPHNALERSSKQEEIAAEQVAYQEAQAEHEREVTAALAEFEAGLGEALAPWNCKDHSIVKRGLTAIETIANEEVSEGIEAINYIAIISDGIDSYEGVECQSQDFPGLANATVFVVTGDPDLKLLNCLEPRRYEAFGALADYLVNTLDPKETFIHE